MRSANVGRRVKNGSPGGRVQFCRVIIRASAVLAALGFLAVPAAAQSPAPAMPPPPKKVHVKYRCHNLNVGVTYDNVKDRALVSYGSRRYTLPRVMSADGGRYMNDKLEWWDKGPTATLTSVQNGNAATLLATCEAIPSK
jgi:membrane-bound inhibitor of C-type lysozyme